MAISREPPNTNNNNTNNQQANHSSDAVRRPEKNNSPNIESQTGAQRNPRQQPAEDIDMVDITQDQELTCPICLERAQNITIMQSCGHAVCMECIMHWTEHQEGFGKNMTCPFPGCRREVRDFA
jgi:hypothetical protein